LFAGGPGVDIVVDVIAVAASADHVVGGSGENRRLLSPDTITPTVRSPVSDDGSKTIADGCCRQVARHDRRRRQTDRDESRSPPPLDNDH